MEERLSTISVELGDRRYPIYIGWDLLGHGGLLTSSLQGRQVMVVTNEVVAPLYLEPMKAALAAYDTQAVILPDGEETKNLEVMNRIVTALIEHRFDRSSTLIALGGGVVGDITGFAAACYQRGVDFIQVPTTLLAQVDSSVGGKTAVNHPLGKNMIGAFHQPRAVISDTRTLTTLDDRQLSAGLAEVIKYGLICDPGFFQWLEGHMTALLARDPGALGHAIRRSCEIKAEIVAGDERESGTRALLNLGHTFGHAIETGLGYGRWLHGEAVAAGLCMAANLSARMGWISRSQVERIEALIRSARLPQRAPLELSVEKMLSLIAVDKKARDGTIRLILLEALGKAVITSRYDTGALKETLLECRTHAYDSNNV